MKYTNIMKSLSYLERLQGDKFSLDAKMENIDHMGVSKNRGTPKWMVYIGKPY